MFLSTVTTLVSAGAVALAAGGSASPASPNGLIAFTRSDPPGIYAVRPDGSGLRTFLRPAALKSSYADLAWSPDGRRLAFLFWQPSDGDGEPDLCVAKLGGEEPRCLALGRGLKAVTSPTWSPDGRRIAFSAHAEGNRDIYVMNADGSELRRLAKTSGLAETDVAWSPAGGRLAFTSLSAYVPSVYVMSSAGSGVRALLPDPRFTALEPSWSPDGRRLVVTRWKGSARGTELVVVDVNARRSVQLTRNDVIDRNASWSPDGRKIAFVSARHPDEGTNWENGIYVMNADGSRRTRLARGGYPAWQPLPAAR